jgi:hypothetical protein
MLLTTVRHKSIELFTWLLCFLTFYLGFNQQVMCYELLPQGGIYNIHLQFIECDPLASYGVPTKHSPENNNVPEVLSAKRLQMISPLAEIFTLHLTRRGVLIL